MGASKRVNGMAWQQGRAAKRVALVIPHLGMGGAQRVATFLANHWVAQGYEVAIITTIDGKDDFYSLDSGVTRIRLQPPAAPTDSVWKRLAKGAALPFRPIAEKCGAIVRAASRSLRRVRRLLWLVLRPEVQPFSVDGWRSQAEQGFAGRQPGRLLKALGLVGFVLLLPFKLVISVAWLLGKGLSALAALAAAVTEALGRAARALAHLAERIHAALRRFGAAVGRATAVATTCASLLRARMEEGLADDATPPPLKLALQALAYGLFGFRIAGILARRAMRLVRRAFRLVIHFALRPVRYGVRVLRRLARFAVRALRLGIRLVLRPVRYAIRAPLRAVRRAPGELKKELRLRFGGPVRAAMLETLARRRTLGPFGYPYARFLGWYAWRVGALRRQLRELRPDVVLSMLGATNIIAVSASRGLPHRLVISERNDPAIQELQQPWQEMRPLIYPGAHIVSANSHGAVDTMRSFCPPHKLAYVPNPIMVGPMAPDAERRESIVFLGRLVHQKAPDVLIDAYAKLLELCPSWTLEMVGDGPMADELRERVRSLEISASVTFHGVLSDPSPILGRAQMFVLPSRFEGTPNALLEAMASKLACVVSDASPGPLSLVEHGSTGLVVKTGCVDSLGESMAKLARSKTLRKRLASKAYRRIQEFRIERVVTIWDELLFAETPTRIQSNGRDGSAPIPVRGEAPRLSPSPADP